MPHNDQDDTHDASTPASRWSHRTVLAIAVAVALVLGLGTAWVIQDDDPPPEAQPAAIPSLQDLAETADATPGDEEPAPDFAVPTLDGTGFTLSDHIAGDGRPVILNLWASWCFPCRAEMPTLDLFQDAHPEVAVVGVAVQDDSVAAEDFANEIGVDYVIGFDEKDRVNVEYAPLGLPATFWISADGQIVKRLFGTLTEDSLEADLSVFAG